MKDTASIGNERVSFHRTTQSSRESTAQSLLNMSKILVMFVVAILTKSKVNYFFYISFFSVVIAVLIKLPSLVVTPEFYAETMTIFFERARSNTLFELLTFVEADYLVTFQLLVSYVLVNFFGVEDHFPGVINFLFLLFIAFSVSLINMRDFRVLIKSDYLRFMIGLSLGLTPYVEVYQLLHANLFGVMIYYLFIFVDKNRIGTSLFYTLVIFLFLVGIARPNMVAFLPVYTILLFLAIKKRKVRDIIFYGTGCVSLGLQSFVMIMAQLYWSVQKDSGIYNVITGIGSFIEPVYITVLYYFRTILGVIFKELSGRYILTSLLFITVILILLMCYQLYIKRKYFVLKFFIASQIIILLLVYLIAFSSPASVRVDWSIIHYDPMRWWAYSNYITYISLMVLAYNAVQVTISGLSNTRLRDYFSRISTVVLSILPVLFHILPFYYYQDVYAGSASLSNWERYRHLMQNENYYIPINPPEGFNWGLAKDNEVLRFDIIDESSLVTDKHDKNKLVETNLIDFSKVNANLKLRGIMLVNHGYHNIVDDIVIRAYDKDGKTIAIPHRLDDFSDKYLYYHFADRIQPASIAFFNENLQRMSIRSDFIFFGKMDSYPQSLVIKVLK